MKEKRSLKKIKFLFLFLGLLAFAPKSVSAEKLNYYNGQDTSGKAVSQGSCADAYKYSYFCQSNGDGKRTDGVRISFVYTDENGYEKMGSIDAYPEKYNLSNAKSAGTIKTENKTNSSMSLNDYNSSYNYMVWDEKFSMKGGAAYFEEQLLTGSTDANGNVIAGSKIDQLAIQATGCSLAGSSDCWNKKSEAADPSGNGINRHGYRILIEPVRVYFGKNGEQYVMTPSELAATIQNTGYTAPNGAGAAATPQQIAKFLREGEFFYTEFDDIGIESTLQCSKGNPCTTEDFLGLGHGVHIIDMDKIVQTIQTNISIKNPECDWEELAKKKLGDSLTPEEEACCDKLQEEIKSIVDIEMDTTYCMAVSESVPEYVTCMQNWFIKWQLASGLLDDQQQQYKDLYEKYPVCGCDYDEVEKIEAEYKRCRENMITSDWMSSWFQGKQTQCEVDRTSAISRFYAYNSPEICPQDVLFPDSKENPKSCKIINGKYYGKNGTEVSKDQYDKECEESPNGKKCQIINGVYYGKNGTIVTEGRFKIECDDPPEQIDPCDENDPNSFPIPGTAMEGNYECCYYFEDKMKSEYEDEAISKGLRDTALQNYVKTKTEDWFNEKDKDYRKYCLEDDKNGCDINDKILSEECCKELKVKYEDDPTKDEEFWIAKGCEQPNPCTWHEYAQPVIDSLTRIATAVCSAGGTNKGQASDTKRWDCIWESDEITSGKELLFKDYYIKYSNPYCAVYCREDVNYEFPGGEMPVKAGNFFTVNLDVGHTPNWSPITFKSIRTCKTSSSALSHNIEGTINQSGANAEWESTNLGLLEAWDALYIAETMNYSFYNKTLKTVNGCSKELDDGTVIYGDVYECENPANYTTWKGQTANYSCGTWCSLDAPPIVDTCGLGDTVKYFGAKLKVIEDDIWACTNWEKFDDYRDKSFASFTRDIFAYKGRSAVTGLQGCKKRIVDMPRYKKYETYVDFHNYEEFNPELEIDYKEPTYSEYNYKELLKKIETPMARDDNFDTGEIVDKGNRAVCPAGNSFPFEPCKASGHVSWSGQLEAHATYTKQYDYKMDPSPKVFNLILKPQGTAVSENTSLSSNQIRINLGFSALHVHFMTPSGVYGGRRDREGKGRLDLLYNQFTPIGGTSTGFEHNFDNDAFGVDSYKYDCNYKVENEIIENKDPDCVGDNCLECTGDNCEETTLKGLNLIFRPISLVDPFPGALGNGRNPGSNWDGAGLIENYILNNRGVNNNRIYYDKAPMYQITLTPALIQQIRAYNDRTTYSDFNMDCLSTGRECKSNYLRGELSTHLSSCEIAGNKGTESCCGIGNWNDCDQRDGIERR